MKKFLASILAAFFVVLSPVSAFASTSESMLMFRTIPVSTLNLTEYIGAYYRPNEAFSFNSKVYSGLSNGSVVSSTDFSSVSMAYNYAVGHMPVVGFSVGSPDRNSSLSIPDGSTLRISINDVFSDAFLNGVQYFLYSDSAVPIRVFADFYYTATQQIGTTHSSTYTQDLGVDISNFISPAQVPSLGKPSLDFNLILPVSAPSLPEDSNIDRLYNIELRYIKVYAVLDFSQYFNGNTSLLSQLSSGSLVQTNLANRFLGSDSPLSTRFYLSYDEGSSAASTTINVLQSSISSMGSNISSNINQVKTQITQATSTITNRIQTLETNVSTGLNNVVESARQNTQNIINTVTQKVDQVKETVTEVKDSILDLPNKIQEMLLGLIVPDSDTMADKYSEFSGLLEEKLGIIYQVPMMLFDFFDTIVNAATTPQTSLTLPAFQLPWIDGSTLTVWQPMEYRIIPEGMQVLSDLIKTITSMTVVVLTFNSVKRAYERFLRS